jgi:hypothetical protein
LTVAGLTDREMGVVHAYAKTLYNEEKGTFAVPPSAKFVRRAALRATDRRQDGTMRDFHYSVPERLQVKGELSRDIHLEVRAYATSCVCVCVYI